MMLKSIYMVTLLVINGGQVEQAWKEDLGYRIVGRGAVSNELAEAWRRPGVAGRPYAVMQPQSGKEVFVRLIEVPEKGNYEAMKTLGWNAVEIHAQDPDALVQEIDPERFRLIGPPAFLSGGENIRAAQVIGPAGELLYFTHVIDPARSTFNIGTATSRVDRVFIMVLGTSDLATTTRFYADRFGQEISGPWPYQVSVLSRAWGKPDDTMYDLSIAQLQGPFLIEIDQYPAEAPRRSATSAGLPYGPAVVSFLVDDLDGPAQSSGQKPARLSEKPYNGRQVLLIEGPSGEWIELVGPTVD